MEKRRTFREPLDPAWAEALLNTPSVVAPDKTVAVALKEARQTLMDCVVEAHTVIQDHAFREVFAEAAAARAKWRGSSNLVVGDDGVVYLETLDPLPEGTSPISGTRNWTSPLPPIGEIRARATSLGIDVASFGRSKTKLIKAIEGAETALMNKPKMIRRAPAIGPLVVLNPNQGPEKQD